MPRIRGGPKLWGGVRGDGGLRDGEIRISTEKR